MEELHTSEADRQDLHALVDHIPAGDLPAARKILRALADPVWQSILNAPLDDEPESEAERAAVEKALSDPASAHSLRRDRWRRLEAVERLEGLPVESGRLSRSHARVSEDTIRIAQVKHRKEAYRD
jgi:hypothetical protein